MSKHTSLEIKPISLVDYCCKQSRHSHIPKVLFRTILLAPSGSGKTVLISNMILNLYRDVFERIYIFSPSIDGETIWILSNASRYKFKIILEIKTILPL